MTGKRVPTDASIFGRNVFNDKMHVKRVRDGVENLCSSFF